MIDIGIVKKTIVKSAIDKNYTHKTALREITRIENTGFKFL
jgi:hypothetical protein